MKCRRRRSGNSSSSRVGGKPEVRSPSFAWWTVVLFPLFAFPTLFIIIEGTFDIEKPWGTVALGFFLMTFSEVTMGRFAISMIRTPLQVLFISYLVVGLARMIPTKGGH